jgi:hypothetical protein
MSGEQKRFDDLMRRVIKVTPEELKRRLEVRKAAKKPRKVTAKDRP